MLKRTISLSLKTLSLASLLLAAEQATAQSGHVLTQVDSVLVTADEQYGGCMALLSVGPQGVLPSCGWGWVTFSCSGEYADRVRAYRMLDQAQLANTTGYWAYVEFQDDKTHDGYCFATRIDVYGG